MKKRYIKQECKHRHLENLIECRKNYPFGRKSEPVYSFKRIWGKECKDCGKLFRMKKQNGRTTKKI